MRRNMKISLSLCMVTLCWQAVSPLNQEDGLSTDPRPPLDPVQTARDKFIQQNDMGQLYELSDSKLKESLDDIMNKILFTGESLSETNQSNNTSGLELVEAPEYSDKFSVNKTVLVKAIQTLKADNPRLKDALEKYSLGSKDSSGDSSGGSSKSTGVISVFGIYCVSKYLEGFESEFNTIREQRSNFQDALSEAAEYFGRNDSAPDADGYLQFVLEYKQALGAWYEYLGSIVDLEIALIEGFIEAKNDDTLHPLRKCLNAAASDIEEIIDAITARYQDEIDKINKRKQDVEDALEELEEVIKEAAAAEAQSISEFVDQFGKLIQSIDDFADAVSKLEKEIFDDVVDYIQDLLKQFGDDAKDFFEQYESEVDEIQKDTEKILIILEELDKLLQPSNDTDFSTGFENTLKIVFTLGRLAEATDAWFDDVGKLVNEIIDSQSNEDNSGSDEDETKSTDDDDNNRPDNDNECLNNYLTQFQNEINEVTEKRGELEKAVSDVVSYFNQNDTVADADTYLQFLLDYEQELAALYQYLGSIVDLETAIIEDIIKSRSDDSDDSNPFIECVSAATSEVRDDFNDFLDSIIARYQDEIDNIDQSRQKVEDALDGLDKLIQEASEAGAQSISEIGDSFGDLIRSIVDLAEAVFEFEGAIFNGTLDDIRNIISGYLEQFQPEIDQIQKDDEQIQIILAELGELLQPSNNTNSATGYDNGLQVLLKLGRLAEATDDLLNDVGDLEQAIIESLTANASKGDSNGAGFLLAVNSMLSSSGNSVSSSDTNKEDEGIQLASESSSSGDDDSDGSSGTSLAILLGCVAIISGVIIAGLVIRRRRRRSLYTKMPSLLDNKEMSMSYSSWEHTPPSIV